MTNRYLETMTKMAAAPAAGLGRGLLKTFGGAEGKAALSANHSGFAGALTGENAQAHLHHAVVQHVEKNAPRLSRTAGKAAKVDEHLSAMEGMSNENKINYMKGQGMDHTDFEQAVRHQTNARIGTGIGAAGTALALTSGGNRQ